MLEQVESLAYVNMAGTAAEKRDEECRERTAAGQDALMPYHDETGTAQMWDEHREVFGYDAEVFEVATSRAGSEDSAAAVNSAETSSTW